MFHLRSSVLSIFKNSSKSQHKLNRYLRKLSLKSGNTPVTENVARSHNNSGVPYGIMGQPTCHTHPHLIAAEDLVPGIKASEFVSRRIEFMRKIVSAGGDIEKGHVVLIPSASKMYMSDMIPFIFRQNSDFYYLTGCMEPDSVLMMTSLPGQDSPYKTILFLRGSDPKLELWDGPRTSLNDAIAMFKVDATLSYSDLLPFLKSYLPDHKTDILWYTAGSPVHFECDSMIRQAVGSVNGIEIQCPRTVLASQRLIKSPSEIALMQQTCEVGSEAINKAMSCTKPGLSEHDIHASIDYWCRRAGAIHLAFPPVVGGGSRATTIHYIHDNQILTDQEFLLVDAGCQHSAYNSDITRTWPVSGKFTPAQAVLYDIVYNVQRVLLDLLRRERPSLDKFFAVMCSTLGQLLQGEGIIPKNKSTFECNRLAFKFCPHHVSHYLGLDVHDTPQIKRNIPVVPGMVITIEPGIYIPENEDSVPKEFRGIGIRIEDDVLITNGDPLVLTESCIKSRRQIESMVGSRELPE